MLGIKINHASAIRDDPIGTSREPPVDGQFMPHFPSIHAPFAGNHVRDARAERGLPPVAVSREDPGMHQAWAQAPKQGAQPPIRGRVELPRLADRVNRNRVGTQRLFERPTTRQRADVYLVKIFRQLGRQQRQLLLGAALVECRDDLHDTLGHGWSPVRSSGSRAAT